MIGDKRGNVYGRLPGRDPNALVMVTAHADEIGFMVTAVRVGWLQVYQAFGHPTDMVLPTAGTRAGRASH
ncbi:MAG: hypothetical protein U0992_06755 [Planctomycetaceae bacterium]